MKKRMLAALLALGLLGCAGAQAAARVTIDPGMDAHQAAALADGGLLLTGVSYEGVPEAAAFGPDGTERYRTTLPGETEPMAWTGVLGLLDDGGAVVWTSADGPVGMHRLDAAGAIVPLPEGWAVTGDPAATIRHGDGWLTAGRTIRRYDANGRQTGEAVALPDGFAPLSMCETPDGGAAIAGTMAWGEETVASVLKLDDTLRMSWQWTGEAGIAMVRVIAVDGGVVAAGGAMGPKAGATAVALTDAGKVRWTRAYGEAGAAIPMGLAALGDGCVLLADAIALEGGIVALQLDGDGAVMGTYQMAASYQADFPMVMAVDGGVWIVGYEDPPVALNWVALGKEDFR